jgi:uncharacterized protein with FMN-binding domain
MTKIWLWCCTTVTAVVLLFGYHTSTEGIPSAAAPPAIVGSSTTGSTGSTGSTGAGGSGTSGSSRRSGSGGSSGSSTPSPTPSAAAARTVTGAVAQTQWGPVQVQLTVASGAITAVDVLEYPNGNGRDAEINAYALPVLVQETLSAQSARIDMVSGATFTSEGYLQSLQSALDQADL